MNQCTEFCITTRLASMNAHTPLQMLALTENESSEGGTGLLELNRPPRPSPRLCCRLDWAGLLLDGLLGSMISVGWQRRRTNWNKAAHFTCAARENLVWLVAVQVGVRSSLEPSCSKTGV